MAGPKPSSRGGNEEGGVTTPSDSSFTHIQSTPNNEIDTNVEDSPSALTMKGESSHMFDSSSSKPARSSQPGVGQRKYRLWYSPVAQDDYCFRLIGQGSTFCINKRCSTKHKNTGFFNPLPGEAYVLKNTSSVFKEPTLKIEIMGDILKEKWLKEAATLEEWTSRFLLIDHERLIYHHEGELNLGKHLLLRNGSK